MLSRLNDLVASALPMVCVIAGSSLVVVLIVALLVREIAIRAIERATPDQVPAVIAALTGLITPFRWIWPWSAKPSALRSRTTRKALDNGSSSDGTAGGQP